MSDDVDRIQECSRGDLCPGSAQICRSSQEFSGFPAVVIGAMVAVVVVDVSSFAISQLGRGATDSSSARNMLAIWLGILTLPWSSQTCTS